jgi:hypothetical protein
VTGEHKPIRYQELGFSIAGVLGGENSSVREIKRVREDSYIGDQRRQSAFYIAASFLESNCREQREKRLPCKSCSFPAI